MPVETQRRGVVAELATADFEDRPSEILYRLARMHIGARGQDRADVHERRVALQHAVGDEHQPVADLQRQRLHPIAASGSQPEWGVGLQAKLIDLPSPEPKRGRMAGVDDGRRGSCQVDPRDQTGDELAFAGLLGQRIICQLRLLGQLNPPPAGIA